MYRIKIEKVETVERTVKGEWCIIGETPLTKEEALEAYKSELPAMKNRHGYAPDRVQPVTETREVLSQEVEDLDLAVVIKAINGL